MKIPAVTAVQMADVDRLMIEVYGIALIQMMENAGHSLAELSRRMLGGSVVGSHVAVLAGAGNNGGGGLVAARHLANWGVRVEVILAAPPEQLKEVPARQYHALAAMDLIPQVYRRDSPPNLGSADLLLDAIIGYGLRGHPRGLPADLVWLASESGRPILALDVPSGLDSTTGAPGNPCIRATATLTLALPKTGLLAPQAAPYVGDLFLADIGVPPALYRRLGMEVGPIFAKDNIVHLTQLVPPGTIKESITEG